MKKTLSVMLLASILCLFFGTTVFASETTQYPITLEGGKIDGQALVCEGSLYLPLRPVCSSLGYKITWLGKGKKLEMAKEGENIGINLEDYRFQVNDHQSYLTDIKVVNRTTYLNETFFEDNLGLKVSQKEGAVSITSVRKNPITIKNVREASETDEIKMTLQYLQLEGLKDKAVQDRLNSVFKEAAEEAKNEGLKNAGEMKDAAKAEGAVSPNKCETYFDYTVKYNQKGLLSIVFFDYQYTGGAHGLTVQSSKTFDLATGQEYLLKDFFPEEMDYVGLISGEVKKSMEKQGIVDDLLNPFEAISPNQSFYLNNDALVVYFQSYEYLPYAAGIPEFGIDYGTLGENLKADFNFLK